MIEDQNRADLADRGGAETGVARGRGLVRLKDGRCWTLLTTMTEHKGFEEKKGERRPAGAEHGVQRGRRSWLEKREEQAAALGYAEQPHVVIIGGGQGGIALASRLRRLEVPTIVVEKNARAGDSWRNRYKSLCLHDPVWYDHLPYLKFPDNWPVFSPKDKVADWLESYARVMELNYWSSTEAKAARYDETADPNSGIGTAAGVGTTTAAAQMGTRTGMGTRTDASLVGGPPDGTPGNPPGTMLSRGTDEVLGTNISGAHPENEARGATGSTKPGTATGGVTGNPRR